MKKLLLLFLLVLSAHSAEKNIIFIITDDQSLKHSVMVTKQQRLLRLTHLLQMELYF